MLCDEIVNAYRAGATNYPPSDGLPELRQEVTKFITAREGIEYAPSEIVIACGARPIIYAIFRTVVEKGDKVIFPIPSWNNNHYCHMSEAEKVEIVTTAENNFMPTAEEIRPHLKGATLLSLCSPLNPTGTVFTKEGLAEICDLVLAENASRDADEKPLFVMYDQIYWSITMEGTEHYNPVTLRPAMRNYTVFVDGISKCFAATGLRVGWAIGPAYITHRMRAILSHVGAWAPKAEQIATAKFLANDAEVDIYLHKIRADIKTRLTGLYDGFVRLKSQGMKVDAISPQGAIYLTVQFNLAGCTTPQGNILRNARDVYKYILDEAKVAIVPFYAFGSDDDNSWYRISVGTLPVDQIENIITSIESALQKLK
ncbi:MAG TPA: aminotransferase class I/II-fold pyridoxal phosphate-dependent enzyme [Bacteroidia bacterium]|nr:aminotransferase class I/II-fold pyridoxal phosphate-dependent enzyme [Bacteroidia bacterium]